MDRKWLVIGLLAVGMLFLIPKKKARNRIKALSGIRYENISEGALEEGYTVKYKNKMAKVIEISQDRNNRQYTKIRFLKNGKEIYARTNDILLPVERKDGFWYYGGVRKYDDTDYVKKPKQMKLFGGLSGLSGWVEDYKDKMLSMPIDRLEDVWKENADYALDREIQLRTAYKDYQKMKPGVMKKALATAINTEQAKMNQRNELEAFASMLIDKYYEKPKGQMKLFGLSAISLNKRKVCKADVTNKKIHCRVQNPKEFGAFFMRTSTTPGVKYVMGMPLGTEKAVLQSVLFDKQIWDTRQAKNWFNRNVDRLMKRDKKTLNLQDLGKGRNKMHDEDYFLPRQQEMFPGMRRELVLEAEDNASIFTVDPLDVCLERQGWEIPKVRKYQQNISAKMTLDMFGKVEKLSGKEVMLQDAIQKCLERMTNK